MLVSGVVAQCYVGIMTSAYGDSGRGISQKGRRACGSCGALLARDNTGSLCSRCLREHRDELRTPPANLPDEFWQTDDFIAAFESQHIGRVLKVYRNHPRHRRIYGKALNQETLGRWLGIGQSALSKIENGPRESNTDVVGVYADKLYIPRRLLWFKSPGEKWLSLPQESASNPEIITVGIAVPAPKLVRPLDIGFVSGNTEMADAEEHLQRLAAGRSHFEKMYRNSGGLVTGHRIEQFLARQTLPIAAMLTGGHGGNNGGMERRAKRAIGGLIALAGVCSYDSEDWRAANEHFYHALTIAEQMQDRGFHAYVIALMVNQALALNDYKSADALADIGLHSSISAAATSLTVDLQAMKARALAAMGDSSAALSVINELELSISTVSAHNGIAEASYVQEVQLRAKLAEALTSLGDLTAAQRFADQSFARDDHARGKVNRLASMAMLEIARGDIERAAHVICDMVENAQGMESRRLGSRFAELRAALTSRPAAASKDAIDRLDAALILMS
jgi:hypothetical protein